MSILDDIRAAAIAAVTTQVTSSVSAAVADVPATINPGEEFTFSVTAANTGVDAVRLIDVAYHLTVSSSTILQLKVPASPPARATNDPTAPTLAVGSFVSGMFLFPVDNTLDVGDSDTISALKGKGLVLGNANINCHIHGSVDPSFIIPTGTVGTNGVRNVVVT
jgi:hypothetical protein